MEKSIYEVSLFIRYLEREKEACLLKADTLERDGRQDESTMAKIRANIFDMMAAVSQAAKIRVPQEPASFIQEKIESIPRAWKESLSAAEAHGDYTKVAIERVKLTAMAEISEKFFEQTTENLVTS